MKNKLLLLLLVLGLASPVIAQKTTKVWIVRHAEKDAKSEDPRDPDLSDIGKQRALDLQKVLKGQKIDTIYTTNFKRTKLTALPLADKLALTIKLYNPSNQKELVNHILGTGEGKRFLIVGHSNTVQETIQAFGLEKPVPDLTEEDFDYLFEITIKGDKKEVKVGRYGASNSSVKE